MVSDNLRIDELILQVFEEHEDMFFWPMHTQKDAKSFVKFLHDKGAAYEEIGKEIGEFEHNFSAWRKGLGRVGIGSRMLDRINRTVEEVILSDGEDDTDHNLKLLSKVNQKKETKASEKDPPRTVNGEKKSSPPPAAGDAKQQQADITKSMMKNIEKVSEQITRKSPEPSAKSDPKTEVKSETKSESVTKRNSQEKEVVKSVTETVRVTRTSPEKALPERKKSPPVEKKEEVAKKSIEAKEETKVEKKEEARIEKAAAKVDAEQEQSEQKRPNQEVDDMKKKMEALKKKVEMMKKAKEEAAAAASQQSGAPGDGKERAAQEEPGRKYEAMKKKISDLRSRVTDDGLLPDKASSPERDDAEDHKEELSTKQPPIVKPEEESESSSSSDDEDKTSTESTSSSDLDNNDDPESDQSEDEPSYHSDIDPDNYDSDLDFEMNTEAKRLSSEIAAIRTKTLRQDGPGHLYIFSDSPASNREHRLLVGVSRSPEKKLAEARRYNLSLKQVSATAVDKRYRALKAARKALRNYKIDGERDWYQGPVDVILQRVSAATEKFGSGPALVRFSSDC